jgi:nucleoside phosphorylase/CheY-like chemotaxis protein
MPIKVLLVDDTDAKIEEVLRELEVANIERSDIQIARNSVDALRFLERERIEILIVDLALPHRLGETPKNKGGIELLEDLQRSDRYSKPHHIVGLTAHEDLWNELGYYFEQRAWTLLKYRPRDTEWRDILREFTKYATSAALHRVASYDIDLCVVTALADPELKAIRQLDWGWTQALPLDEKVNIYKGSARFPQKSIQVIAASSLRMGMVDAALLVYKLIDRFRPRYVAMCGICAGVNRSSINLGDVILGQSSWDYQSGKYTSNGTVSQHAPSPDMISISDSVQSAFERLKHNHSIWSDIRERWPGAKPDHSLRVHCGPIATGSAVLADGSLVQQPLETHRKTLGIDMEVYGVYAAGRAATLPSPTVFALKSVCDFADGEKTDQFQSYAAYTSAQALKHLMENLA